MYKIGITLVIIFGVLFYMYSGVSRAGIYEEKIASLSTPHHLEDVNQSIENIEIVAFYLVPRERSINQKWKQSLEIALQELSDFHEVQSGGRSSITYRIIPRPVIGENSSGAYDVLPIEHNSTQALFSISSEIQKRLEDKNGDLYTPELEQNEGSYRVYVVLFEGSGAGGAENIALVARSFLTSDIYTHIGSTILAHEFYHTLGVKDQYEIAAAVLAENVIIPRSISRSNDIMGLGVTRPIRDTYISRDTLRAMGI